MKPMLNIIFSLLLCLQLSAVLGQAEDTPTSPKTNEKTMHTPSCSLDEKELEERKNTVLKTIKTKATKTEKTKEGYIFTLPRKDENIQLITSVILLESECCPFFTFHVSAISGSSDVTFTITAPADTQSFLDELFASKK